MIADGFSGFSALVTLIPEDLPRVLMFWVCVSQIPSEFSEWWDIASP